MHQGYDRCVAAEGKTHRALAADNAADNIGGS